MRGLLAFVLCICVVYGSPYGKAQIPIKNMNGDYSKYEDVEYFDVYSPPISTRYGEVFWTMMDPVPLDKKLVEKFAGKAMAVVSVPIIWAYNHHYCAYLSG